MKYNPTHVLGVDQARSSGWGIAQFGGKVVEHAVAKDHVARVHALQRALDHVQGVIDDLLVVFEDHSGMGLNKGSNRTSRGAHRAPTRSTASILGLGAARGRWDELLDSLGHPELLRIVVPPEDWRIRVLGCTNRSGTDELKERARRWATAHIGNGIVVSHDEAEGMAITAWGALEGMSVLLAGRKERRQSLRSAKTVSKQLSLLGGT